MAPVDTAAFWPPAVAGSPWAETADPFDIHCSLDASKVVRPYVALASFLVPKFDSTMKG
jgi:hypothetical protein